MTGLAKYGTARGVDFEKFARVMLRIILGYWPEMDAEAEVEVQVRPNADIDIAEVWIAARPRGSAALIRRMVAGVCEETARAVMGDIPIPNTITFEGAVQKAVRSLREGVRDVLEKLPKENPPALPEGCTVVLEAKGFD